MNVYMCAGIFDKRPNYVCPGKDCLGQYIRQNEALRFASVKLFEMSNIVTDDFSFDQVLM